MTIITESLISECQSARAVCLNDIFNAALVKAHTYAFDIGLPFIVTNKDIKKIIVNNMIIELCEFKKRSKHGTVFFINRIEFEEGIINIIDEVVDKIELNKTTKSVDFFKKFKKYLHKSGLNYLADTYLKQVSNKLALFR